MQSRCHTKIMVKMDCDAEKLICSVYSSGCSGVHEWTEQGRFKGGEWSECQLPDGLDLANGTYFVKVTACRGAERSSKTAVFAVMR